MTEFMQLACPHCRTANRVPLERLDEHPHCGRCGGALFTGAPIELDDTSFAAFVGRSDQPVVVDFWAAWCAPCRAMAPAFASAAAQLEPHVRLAKLDTEAAPRIAAQFGIRSIPTLVILQAEREIARQSGAMDAAGIVRWVRASTGR
ncbi:MAG: thioredoxin TrxC [Rhodocyclaceae bacterium]|nr:MAG: thioredoxin TrxC [Rhodocyclaceae bacterium]